MSTITRPMLLDETGREMLAAMKEQGATLKNISDALSDALTKYGESIKWSEIQKAVQNGNARSMFKIGDQIIIPWEDKNKGCTYQMPFDVVHFDSVFLETGEFVPGMFLQCHYALPYNLPFNGPNGMTLSGMQYSEGLYYYESVDASSYRLLIEGTDYNIGDTILPGIVCSSVCDPNGEVLLDGYNLWEKSKLRQYLNSDSESSWQEMLEIGDKVIWDLPSAGFLSGFDEDFLSCIRPISVTTIKQTSMGSFFNQTYDRFFLPSLYQMNISHSDSALTTEGQPFEYWKQYTDSPTPVHYEDVEIAIQKLDSRHLDCEVFFRSAFPGSLSKVCSINGNCFVAYERAASYLSCTPVCVIT